MRKILQKEGGYRVGIEAFSGLVVVGVRKSVQDLSGDRAKRFYGADIATWWIAGIDKATKKLDMVALEIDWDFSSGGNVVRETFVIPFDIKQKFIRESVRKVVKDKMLLIANLSDSDPEGSVQYSDGAGITVDVSTGEAVEWLDMDDKGISIEWWKKKEG